MTILDDIDEINIVIAGFDEEIEKIKIDRSAEKEKIRLNDSNKREKDNLEKQLIRLADELDALDKRKFDDSDVTAKVQKKLGEIDVLQLDLDMATGQINECNDWVENFKQFKFYLANKPIEIICHYTNEFLKDLDSEFSVTIEGFKMLKSGEMRAELTPMVYRNGLNPKPYSSYSEGEKVRLNIAVDLALQRLVNENSSEGLQFYSSDELLNSLDSLGLTNAAKAFNRLNQTICLISHSGNDLNYENIIQVSKKNGITTIV